jgi:hypothetical protein
MADHLRFLRSEDSVPPAWANYHERGIERLAVNPDPSLG